MEKLMEHDAGRIRIARAVARNEAASSALDEAIAQEGQRFREDIEQPPGSQGERGDDVRAQAADSANPFERDVLRRPTTN